jgi:hypothetical protein
LRDPWGLPIQLVKRQSPMIRDGNERQLNAQ